MAGHRDDGTFAEDRAHDPRRKIGDRYGRPSSQMDGLANDLARGYGIRKGEALNHIYGTLPNHNQASKDFIGSHSNENDETLDPWDQEDIDEQRNLRDEANKRGHL